MTRPRASRVLAVTAGSGRDPAGVVASLIGLVAVAAAGLAHPGAAAADTKTFRQATAKDFEEGEATGTSVLPTGEIVPGLVAARIPLSAAFVWCSTIGRDGATAFFGTGDEGKIFAAPARGGPTETGNANLPSAPNSPKSPTPPTAVRQLAALDAPWVTALATLPDGTLLAGTTPGGRVLAVDPKKGSVRPYASVAATHVWALVRDDKAGLTYVGTGLPGKIFAVDARGKSRQVWDSGDKHVVSLMRDSDGTLLAGTSEEAILYRVRADGRAEALQDFEAEEVRAIVRTPAGLFVAVNDFDKLSAAPPAPSVPVAAKGTKIVVAAGGPPASAGSLPRPGARKSRAAVYRIEPDGHIEQVFALADGYLTALLPTDDGSVLAASGTQGHVYRVAPDRTASLVVDLPERQVLTLARSGSAVLAGTGDVGGVYRMQPPVAPGGRYLSKVLDAEFAARWGTLRWLGVRVDFETRSGNTARPDAGWNSWKPLEKIQAAVAGGVGHVGSPGARYLQYRAALSAADSRLRGVTTSYLPQNQRARITELTVADATGAPVVGGVSLGVGAATTTAARPSHSAILRLRWKTDNPDGDDLVYRLAFRQPDESTWRSVAGAGADPLTKPEYDWNTEGIPDGLYIVRVTASDERDQPRDRTLTSSFDSVPLLIDNARPELLELAGRYPVVTGRARDAASAITQIEFAVDGGDFQLVSPADGIADEPIESFSIRLPNLARGTHAVAIRATDSADNIGAAQITVRAP